MADEFHLNRTILHSRQAPWLSRRIPQLDQLQILHRIAVTLPCWQERLHPSILYRVICPTSPSTNAGQPRDDHFELGQIDNAMHGQEAVLQQLYKASPPISGARDLCNIV